MILLLKLSLKTVLTSVITAVTNHVGGDIQELSLSKSSARQQRASVRSEKSVTIKRDFICNLRQINFDGKILPGLVGLET